MIQNCQSTTITAPEELAFINGCIDKVGLIEYAEAYVKSSYGAHLMAVVKEKSSTDINIKYLGGTHMKVAVIILLIIGIEFIVGLFAVSHAFAAKHEPPAIILKRRITVIYNILFNR